MDRMTSCCSINTNTQIWKMYMKICFLRVLSSIFKKRQELHVYFLLLQHLD